MRLGVNITSCSEEIKLYNLLAEVIVTYWTQNVYCKGFGDVHFINIKIEPPYKVNDVRNIEFIIEKLVNSIDPEISPSGSIFYNALHNVLNVIRSSKQIELSDSDLALQEKDFFQDLYSRIAANQPVEHGYIKVSPVLWQTSDGDFSKVQFIISSTASGDWYMRGICRELKESSNDLSVTSVFTYVFESLKDIQLIQ